MTFLNPLVLIGLAAASIPVIFHLLNLRKLKTIEFSTLKFLKELQKTKIRRLKLKQLILLILRTLVVIFAVLAFARPTIQSSLPFFGTYAKKSAVIIIDNSFSMDVSDELGNRFNQAKNIASSVIKSMKEGDEACLIAMADNGDNVRQILSRNKDFLKEELSGIKVSAKVANLWNSLRRAAGIIEESSNMYKEIYIISDAQPNIFRQEYSDTLRLFSKNTLIYFIPVGLDSKTEIQNLSVDSLNVITKIFESGKQVELEAHIRNHFSTDATGVVMSLFFNNDRVAQRSLDIPAGELRTVPISAEYHNSGSVRARVEIESDALEYDNHRHFAFIIPEKPKVALVGSKAKNRFIKLLSDTGNKISAPAIIREINPGDFSGIDISEFDLIILAGDRLSRTDVGKMNQYLNSGYPALIFAGDETEKEIFKSSISQLGLGEIIEMAFSESQPGQFSLVDKHHPVFEGVFKGTTDNKSVVESPKMLRAYPVTAGQGIIEMPGGYFLSEVNRNSGKLLYCAVPPDDSWSNFPVTGLFPVFIYRSISYLTAKQSQEANLTPGTSIMLNIPKRFSASTSFKVIDPANTESFVRPALLPSNPIIELNNLELPGIYSVYTQQGSIVSVVSVNNEPSESVVKHLPEKDIAVALNKKISTDVFLEIIKNTKNVNEEVNRLRTGTELWQLFVLLALACLVAEMLIARSTKGEKL